MKKKKPRPAAPIPTCTPILMWAQQSLLVSVLDRPGATTLMLQMIPDPTAVGKS